MIDQSALTGTAGMGLYRGGDMNWMMMLATIVTSIATVVIAVYAMKAHKLTEALRQKDGEHQQEIKDLFQAIVISN